MDMNFEILKKHPLATGASLVGVFLAVYLYRKYKGGSSTGTMTVASPTIDPQVAALQVAAQNQQLASQAQIASAQAQANVMQQAIAAQQETTDAQTAAQLKAAQAQYDAITQVAQLQANTATTINTTDAGVASQALTNQATLGKQYLDVMNNYVNTQGSVEQQKLNLSGQALNYVNDVNGSQNRVSIIESATGNVPGSIAAENGATMSAVSGNQTTASITDTAIGVGGGILKGLFG